MMRRFKHYTGAFLDVLQYAVFWLGVIGIVINAVTAYEIWIRDYTGWSIVEFFLIGVGIVWVIMLVEYFILYKARQYFRNRWEYLNESPIKADLEDIKRKLDEIAQCERK